MNDLELDITGIDHAELLAALYNNARPLGPWGHRLKKEGLMSKEEAQELLEQHRIAYDGKKARFDYVHGRPLKVDFVGNTLRGARLYDRDQGQGECVRIVQELRAKAKP